MFEFPIIRFDNRIWLEKMLDGELYMRNSLYYQRIENKDEARGDANDGSIPYAGIEGFLKFLSGREVRNGRIVMFDRFIKCFYHCTNTDFSYIGGNLWRLKLPETAMHKMNVFKTDSVMLIFSPSVFIEQVLNACQREQKRAWYGDVQYVVEGEYSALLQNLLANPSESYKVPFYKNARFSDQQEFRICIQHPFDGVDRQTVWQDIPTSVADLDYTLDIGPIKDACIVSIDNLYNNGILLNRQKEQYYVCEDSTDAENEG